MSRYAARPVRNWLRMLKSNFSAADADPDIASEVAVLSVRMQLLCLRMPPLFSALERICLDLVKIIMLMLMLILY